MPLTHLTADHRSMLIPDIFSSEPQGLLSPICLSLSLPSSLPLSLPPFFPSCHLLSLTQSYIGLSGMRSSDTTSDLPVARTPSWCPDHHHKATWLLPDPPSPATLWSDSAGEGHSPFLSDHQQTPSVPSLQLSSPQSRHDVLTASVSRRGRI